MNPIFDDIKSILRFFTLYFRRKIYYVALFFEKAKNFMVDRLIVRRGVLQKRVWHGSMIGLAAFGMITSGLFGNQTIISATFPGVGGEDPRFINNFEPSADDPVLNSFHDTRTTVSAKVRSEVIEYEVKSGDTISSIAAEYDISSDTIKWANNLTNEIIKPGDTLKILPVSGIAHTVKSGDTLESVAKKYEAESQAMLDYPFNDIADDLKLKTGQLVIVPEGIPPQAPAAKRPIRTAPQYLAQGLQSPTFNAPGGGNFIWPTHGTMTQYFSWYHPGIDVANNSSPAVVAGDGGVVTVAGWPDSSGYGNRVIVDHGNGYKTLYAHFSNVYVTAGQRVSRGQVLGQMGTTGRSTGIHLHLEVRYNGIAVNPLAILK